METCLGALSCDLSYCNASSAQDAWNKEGLLFARQSKFQKLQVKNEKPSEDSSGCTALFLDACFGFGEQADACCTWGFIGSMRRSCIFFP